MMPTIFDHLRKRRRPFLTARWEYLALVTYGVEPGRLEALTPPRCELDLMEGKGFVSLVAFDFKQTRVLGVEWPGHRDFAEINLRFYVKEGERRGVCFVREFVPRRAIAAAARGIYNEPYRCARMKNLVKEGEDRVLVEHRIKCGGAEGRLRVVGSKPSVLPEEGSVEHFFKEHEWGYGTSRGGKLLRYRVEHPAWEVWPVVEHEVEWDWEGLYGREWGFLKTEEPHSVILARGSEVRVFPKVEI